MTSLVPGEGITNQTPRRMRERKAEQRPVGRGAVQALQGPAARLGAAFFATEFFAPSFAATKKQILRRLWGVLSTPAFERMFMQRDNKLDLYAAMIEGKIILVSTAKDRLKSDGSALLGRFFIAMIARRRWSARSLRRRSAPRPSSFIWSDSRPPAPRLSSASTIGAFRPLRQEVPQLEPARGLRERRSGRTIPCLLKTRSPQRSPVTKRSGALRSCKDRRPRTAGPPARCRPGSRCSRPRDG